MNLFDASALLVSLQDEPGVEVVEEQLSLGGAFSADNRSEVAQKVRASEDNWPLARALILSQIRRTRRPACPALSGPCRTVAG